MVFSLALITLLAKKPVAAIGRGTAECFISLRSPTEHENRELRHAGMDSRHPGVQDASGDVHVGLDSSTPCWNDGIEESYQD